MEHANPILLGNNSPQKFITIGEVMLRLTPPNYEKIRMASSFEASYGGSEANIALALANLGVDSTFFSVVPNNSLGKSAIRWLRCNDVHCTPMILSTKEETPSCRLGTYYLETGYGIRPSKVIYDRMHSALTEYDLTKVDLQELFEGFDWLHLSGITPAHYCKAIGLALSSDEIDSDDESVIPHLEDIKESIESHFIMSFSADFYYYVLKGYLRRKGTKEFYESDDLAFELMARAIMYERDVDALAIKSQLLNSNGIFNEDYIKKDKCVFFLLSLIYRQMAKVYTEEQKATIRNGWNEAELYSQNSQRWASLMSDDDSSFDGEDLKLLADNVDKCITFDDSEDGEDSDDEEDSEGDVKDEVIDLKKYEHIEEEEPTLKQKLSKKRFFTQYIVIDGTFYSRGLELSRKEFDGDIERKSDLEKLKAIFEDYYDDIVVGAESCYEKYTPDDVIDYFGDDEDDSYDYEDETEDDYGIKLEEELNEFWGNCIEFTNILESKLN